MTGRIVHIVDDEEAIRRSMQLMLRVMGYEPEIFESGTAFMDALPSLSRGSILLDLRMPDIDGLEVQRHLSAAGAEHAVIVMSGHGDLAVAVTAMEQGAIAFLEKPFSRVALQGVLTPAFQKLEDPEAYIAYLQAAAAAIGSLDAEDRRLLELVARGQDIASVAQQTGRSTISAEMSRSRIFEKLGAETLTDVLRIAFAARRASTL